MKRKLFTFLLAFVASIGLTNAQKVQIGDLYYNLDTTSLTAEVTWQDLNLLSNYPGMTTVYIPTSIEYSEKTYSVTRIGTQAFWECGSLISITISNSVTSIGDDAFDGCSNLTSPVYNEHVFAYMPTSYSGAYTIPDGIESIAGGAFTGCHNLTSVTIPNSVTRIGDYAFYNCNSLTTPVYNAHVFAYMPKSYSGAYTIPEGIESIAGGAFSGCSHLTSITIPESVTSIGYSPFSGCNGLTSPIYNAHVFAYMPTSYSGAYTIPEGIESIASGAFMECSGLTSVTIPNSVTSIEDKTFYRCGNLTSVTIGNSVTSIGAQTFYFCTNLTSIAIPNSVTSIGMHAFESCRSLTSVTIPNSVTTIGDYSFDDCRSLISVVIPDSVTSIGRGAFYMCSSLTSATIGSSVTSIGYETFMRCTSLTSIIWNAKKCKDFSSTSTPFYHKGIFDISEQITSFVFGAEVEYIPAYLCYNMTNVPEIIVTCSIEIGTNALFNCNYRLDGISNIVLPDTILCHRGAQLCDDNGQQCQTFNDDGVYTVTYTNIFGCDSIVARNVIIKQDTTYLDTTICYLSDLCIDGDCYEWPTTDLIAYQNKTFTWDRTLTTQSGCDSVVSLKVFSSKIVTPTTKTTHEQDYSNSGKITLSGGKYDYYTANGERNKSLYNLPSGEYTLAFYNNVCDEPEEITVQIYRYGMRVNSMYYLLNGESHTATLTYRGTSYSDYSGEYSGNLTIPKTVTFEGEEYQVTGINNYTFSGCSNIKSIKIESETPITMPYNSGLSNSCVIYVPYGSLSAYKSASYWSEYNIHVIDPSHAVATCGATSASIVIGNENEQTHIASCGVNGAEEFAGNVIEYCGLEPETTSSNVSFKVKTIEGDVDEVICSFTTTALTLITQQPRIASSSTAILLAETNMADAEVNCGFEWRRDNQPEAMASTKVYAPVANGVMAGRLKGLKDDVYYKYRAFYESTAGNTYYGDWQYIFTGDNTVEFDPVMYTYPAQAVTETTAILKGYALAGSVDFTEQGFEYWVEKRVVPESAAGAPRRAYHSTFGEHMTVQASGISMKVTLTGLDEGSVYKYRSYAIVNGQTIYGAEQSFTTRGEYLYTVTFVDYDGTILGTDKVHYGTAATAPEDPTREGYNFAGWDTDFSNVTDDLTITATYSIATALQETLANDCGVSRFLRNGQIFILRDGKTYTVQGQEVK